MTNNTYQCAKCKGVFEKAWTDEEAESEREEAFGSPHDASDVVVCDDCYKLLTQPSPLLELMRHLPTS